MSKKVLVIGGAGYIGAHMVRTLLREKRDVAVFDNVSTGHRDFVPKAVPFVKGDLRNDADIKKALKELSVDTVMHFAASSQVGESVEKPLAYYENNVGACIHLLKAMKECGVRKIIFSSTASVYGNPSKVPIDEGHAVLPNNPYGQTKLAIEHMLRDLARAGALLFVSLRYFNAAGADASGEIGEKHAPETHLIPNLLKVIAKKNKELVVFGDDYPTPDGTGVRDYIHVEDLCRAHLLALDHLEEKAKNAVFNLGSGKGFSVKEVISKAEEVTGKKASIRVGRRRPGDPPALVASFDKAKAILGWEPRRSLEEMLQSAWKWEKGAS